MAGIWRFTADRWYERPVTAGLNSRLTLAAKYSSDYNTGSDLAPQKVQPDFWLVNGSVALMPTNGPWEIELWARNLTGEDYAQVAFGAPFQTGTIGAFLGAPRTVGASVRVRY